MTMTAMPPAGVVAGISGAEFGVMVAAAAAFERDHAVVSVQVAAGLLALRSAVPAGAAGAVRARRGSYLRSAMGHHMQHAGAVARDADAGRGRVIEGISAAEHAVMVAAAGEFERAHVGVRGAAGFGVLRSPVRAGGAGTVRARYAEYEWTQQGGHRMRHSGALRDTGTAGGDAAGGAAGGC